MQEWSVKIKRIAFQEKFSCQQLCMDIMNTSEGCQWVGDIKINARNDFFF